MMSLNRRMVLSASLVLAVFIALTALALERAFFESARSARQLPPEPPYRLQATVVWGASAPLSRGKADA